MNCNQAHNFISKEVTKGNQAAKFMTDRPKSVQLISVENSNNHEKPETSICDGVAIQNESEQAIAIRAALERGMELFYSGNATPYRMAVGSLADSYKNPINNP